MPETLLHKYFTEPTARELVLEHSRLVAAKALQLARLTAAVASLDLRFIEEAALLHDIGVSQTYAPGLSCFGSHPYICHGIIGREILEAEGLPRHALACERHIGVGLTAADVTRQGLPLPVRDMTPVSAEEKLVCLADLFYTKKPARVREEKTLATIRLDLAKFGTEKVAVFDRWLAEFNLWQPHS
jgi:uncharacterized protein